MIYYLKRNQLDTEKYNNCISSAINSRIYAFSWYLDIVADNWDALVLNDYEAVMPLPWRKKYFIKYIYPPAWTQQLGVFSRMSIDENLIKKFIDSIPVKFKKITIQFNSGNDLNLFKTEKRVNYVLKLNKPYEEVYKGFNKNRKRILKKVDNLNYHIEHNVGSKEFLDFYLNQVKNYQLNKNQILTLKSLLQSNTETVFIWGIRENEKLISGLVWLKDDNRITYLLPISTRAGKEKGLPITLISELIKMYSNTNLVFDFEGSMLKGVSDFYKSFGADNNFYFAFQTKLFDKT